MHSFTCSINQILKKHLGLRISSIGQGTVERAVMHRMKDLGVESQDSYLQMIGSDPAEINALIEEVVIPETWFFRDPGYYSVLGKLVLSGRLPPDGTLKILSVPCATGEEPYTISIALLQTGIPPNRLHVDGVDISSRAIERARAGHFRNRSFRGSDIHFRDIYFTKEENGWKILERIRKTIAFHCGNILSDPFMSRLGQYNVIFCKNLLMYLDTTSRKTALVHLRNLLAPAGYLFAGPAETIFYHDAGFVLADSSIPFLFVLRSGTPPAAIPAGPMGTEPDKTPALSIVSSQTTAPPPSSPQRENPPPDPPPGTDEHQLAAAKRLADTGNLDEARKLLDRDLKGGKATAEHFHLLGVIAEAGQRVPEAIGYFKKAVYLDPTHEESLSLLALLAQRIGDKATAGYYRDRLKRLRERMPA